MAQLDFITGPNSLEVIYSKYRGKNVRITTPAPDGYVIYPVKIVGVGAKLSINNAESYKIIIQDGNEIEVPIGTGIDEWH